MSGRRHDFIAIHIQDEREKVLPNIGIITLEDAETGEQIEINTADRATRMRFTDFADEHKAELSRTLRRNNIDAITLRTGEDYLPALRSFFKQRERRLAFASSMMPILSMSIFLAEEFHDIAPPVDYSLMPPWVVFVATFVGLCLHRLARLVDRAKRVSGAAPQLPRERALEALEQISDEIETINPYQFSIRVSDILRRYVTEQYGFPVTRQTSVEFLERAGENLVRFPRTRNRCSKIF